MDLNSYFETLATQHVDIAHTEENKAFFRVYASAHVFFDNDFHKNLKYIKSPVVLISQFNEDGTLPIPEDDFSRQSPLGTLYILARIKDADIESARLKAIEIRDDILARVKAQIRNLTDTTFPKNFKFEQISCTTIGRVADNFYGVTLNISFSQGYKPVSDAEKWIALEN